MVKLIITVLININPNQLLHALLLPSEKKSQMQDHADHDICFYFKHLFSEITSDHVTKEF